MFKMKDFGFFTDSNVYNEDRTIKKSYSVWKSMVHRCYNSNHKSFNKYGGANVYICLEWHWFSNFERWFDENYIEGYFLDKDISGMKQYCPDGCVFISREDNNREMVSRRDSSFYKEKMSGRNHHKSKDLLYYRSNAVTKSNFKTSCIKQGWNYEDFEEIYSGEKYRSAKLYFYKIK